jgi:hypothetical protein
VYKPTNQEKSVFFQEMDKNPTHGGKRDGAGRPNAGKKRFQVTLTESAVAEAKERESNLSGLLDRLLKEWLEK